MEIEEAQFKQYVIATETLAVNLIERCGKRHLEVGREYREFAVGSNLILKFEPQSRHVPSIELSWLERP